MAYLRQGLFFNIYSMEQQHLKRVFPSMVIRCSKLITFAESLGGTESLITYPMVQTHPDVPQAMPMRTMPCWTAVAMPPLPMLWSLRAER